MLKKIGSFLIVTVMIMATLTPLTATANQGGQCGDNLIWVLDDSGTLTIAGSGDMWNWEIGLAPWSGLNTSINRAVINYGVTSIGNYAFYACNLTAISIPQSVTSIGDQAFYCCEILTTINIPSSVASIGKEAFGFCDRLVAIFVDDNNQNYCSINGVLFSKDRTGILCYPAGKGEANYTIPEGVTYIGEYAFFCCKSLTSISIPSSVTTIEDWAFAFCDSLTTISIPPCVKSIGEYVFYCCEILTTINIPSSVASIGKEAFGFCDRLVAIFVDDNNQNYCSINGVLFSKDRTGILCYPAGKGDLYYTVPEGVTNIGNHAFSGSNLMSISIPQSVTSIGEYAFEVCSNLTTINIPLSVTVIGEHAFVTCSNLTTINIPLSATVIGDYAFAFCTRLTTISISSSETSIGDDAFYSCNRLTDIYYGGSETEWEPMGKGIGVPGTVKIHYNMPAPSGTIIGSALRTDITAVINDHAIPSFNVDGYTYIVAEDLKHYGFAVYYDNVSRTLAINRNYSKTTVTKSYEKPHVPENEVGIKEHDLVATDIVTYVDDQFVRSYNINGYTIIRFDELNRYAGVTFDDSNRIIQVAIPGLN